MGHKGDIEHTYTLSKRLPADVIERMREAYSKGAEKCLVTGKKQKMAQDINILEISGISGHLWPALSYGHKQEPEMNCE